MTTWRSITPTLPRNNCSPKLPQIVWYTVTGTVELLLINIELMQESLEAGQGFTDNEVRWSSTGARISFL